MAYYEQKPRGEADEVASTPVLLNDRLGLGLGALRVTVLAKVFCAKLIRKEVLDVSVVMYCNVGVASSTVSEWDAL